MTFNIGDCAVSLVTLPGGYAPGTHLIIVGGVIGYLAEPVQRVRVYGTEDCYLLIPGKEFGKVGT